MSRIEERLQAMKVDTSEMTTEEKFTAATGLTHYDEDTAANDWYVPGGAANVLSEDELEEPIVETYTAEEAAAFNLNLDGALQYGAIKTPAVEAQEAVYYTQLECDEYNTFNDIQPDDPNFRTTDMIKIPAVEAQDAVLYTNEEVDAYNATLDGAVKEGDPKEQNPSEIEVVSEP